MFHSRLPLYSVVLLLLIAPPAETLDAPPVDKPRFANEVGVLLDSASLNSDKLDRIVQAGMGYCSIPGLSIAVIKDGKVVYSKAFGLKKSTTSEPVSEATLFEACSLTKPVFAFAVNRLADRGVINLDKPLYEYHPQSSHVADLRADARLQMITARHVLAHRTGFPNWRDEKLSIEFAPGSQFGYSGEGFEYLGEVVSHITAKRIEDVLRDEAFLPLGVAGAYAVCDEKIAQLSATGHDGTQPNEKWMPGAPLMAASLHITANDYAKFLLAILSRSGMSEQQWQEMLRPQFADGDATSEQPYCLGLRLQETPYGKKYSHSGRNSGGFSCFFAIYEDKKFGYVFFANNSRAGDFNEILEAYLVTGATDNE